jgi:pre-rRNA-processing protein TSR1
MLQPEKLFILFSLLPYERKATTLNFVVNRNNAEYDAPVKSKDPMVFFCGFRRYVVNPIYSTYSRGGSNNVHKFERFLQKGRSSVGSIYAPIQFGPAPIMMFKHSEDGMVWGPGNISSLKKLYRFLR